MFSIGVPLILTFLGQAVATRKPHIVIIVADDLGWNDVGFHGSDQIPTPNIDALAYSGIILNNYYVTPICTPSRSALMTGKYPIHTGMQHTVLYGAEPRGLPLTETILPEYLKKLGYANHIVGKWHLGSWKKEYTPTYRGFLSHYGYWTGHQDYFDHTAMETAMWGLDMRRGMEPAWEDHGQYSTDLFTKESVKIIMNHDAHKNPLFLYLAHAAVHSGNPYNPLPAPDAAIAKFTNITDYYRKRFAGMLSKLDESVGNVVQALQKKGILNNTIIMFTTDNGGPAGGFNLNAASNWPLRGVKNTLWEGGVRGSAFIWGPSLKNYPRVLNESLHITDWLPTLYAAAGGNPSDLGEIDGINAWPCLTSGSPSGRHITLHNIDDNYGNAAITIGPWKLLKGSTYNGAWDTWFGPSGRDSYGTYDPKTILHSQAGTAVTSLGLPLTLHQIKRLRAAADIDCRSAPLRNCNPLVEPCLYNIVDDPCEKNNIASKYPTVLKKLEDGLRLFNLTAVPPGNLPIDPAGNPKYWDNTWTNFGDYKTSVAFL